MSKDSNDNLTKKSVVSKMAVDAEKANDVTSSVIRESADKISSKAREQIDAHSEKIKGTLSDQTNKLGSAVGDAAAKLSSPEHSLTYFTAELSSHLSELSHLIETGSVDSVATRAKQLAKKNPGLFMLGGFAAGFAISRFFKAGSNDSDDIETERDSNAGEER